VRGRNRTKNEKEDKQVDEIGITTLILVFLVFIMQLRTEFVRRRAG